MAFCELNGVEIPIRVEDAKKTPILIGDRAKTFSGSPRETTRRRLSEWALSVPVQTYETADALKQWINGEGHRWSFDSDLYSTKGLTASSGSGNVVNAGKYGAGVSISAALTFPVDAGSDWTIMGWVWKPSVGAWAHFIVDSAGTKYKNGASTADDPLMDISGTDLVFTPEITTAGLSAWAAFTTYAVTDRVVQEVTGGFDTIFEQEDGTNGLNDIEPNWDIAVDFDSEVGEDESSTYGGPWLWRNRNTGFDDVVFLPFKLPATWVAGVYAEANARAWSALPRLYLDGKIINDGSSLTVKGEVGESSIVLFSDSGTVQLNGETFSLTLTEV